MKEKASQLGHAEVIQKDMATADGEFDTFQNVSLADVKRVNDRLGRCVIAVSEGIKRQGSPAQSCFKRATSRASNQKRRIR